MSETGTDGVQRASEGTEVPTKSTTVGSPDVPSIIARIRKRITEIDEHVARYPSWVGGMTWQHAEDLRAILPLIGEERA